MNRYEALAMAISKINGGLDDPDSKAFSLSNPGLLKTYRPEKKCDGDHYRIFTTAMGGFKALVSELQARCSGQNHRLSPENTLRDLLSIYEFNNDKIAHRIALFVRRATKDESVALDTPLKWFQETPEETL